MKSMPWKSHENVLRTSYENIPELDKFGDIPLPETEHHATLKYANRTKPDLWLESFTEEHIDETEFKVKPAEVLELFNKWCEAEGVVEYNTDSVQFGIR
jgi:hypothetical protein